MSIILDALKKAESERKLGSVPTMHSDSFGATAAAAAPAWSKPIVLATLLGALLVGAAITGFIVWQSNRHSDAGASPSVARAPVSTVVGKINQSAESTPPPIAGMGTEPEKKEIPAVKAPAEVPEAAATSKPETKKKSQSKTEQQARPAPINKKNSEQSPAERKAQAPETKKAARANTTASPAEPQVPSLRDLPENIQREIPAVTIGGYIYSGVPSERSILINNRLLHEGNQIAPGLTLEKMLPKEAVLNYKGYRYRVSY